MKLESPRFTFTQLHSRRPLSSLLYLAVALSLSVLSSVSSSPELCLADLHLLSILYSVSPNRCLPLSSLQWRVSTARLLELDCSRIQPPVFSSALPLSPSHRLTDCLL
ncbi:hypothetical protein HAX54_049859 [Datura stramonium]|uniref:Uncharacterized protein n=1 Tax=Datura stramonium TaxID=4076 RepID=A0ABS8WPM9_DATST|nr:hypothetical protein [Datura stramonium]